MDFLENVGRRSEAHGDTGNLVHVGQFSLNGYERNALYVAEGDGRYADCAYLFDCDGIDDGRGLAVDDIDNDGDLDLVLNNFRGPARILINPGRPGNHWLQLRLVGKRSNRDAIGARVRIRYGEHTADRQVATTRGYLSGQSPLLHFGLGTAARVDEIQIRWPSGLIENLRDVPVDRRLAVVEGEASRALAMRPAR